jgi:hypothetical protein
MRFALMMTIVCGICLLSAVLVAQEEEEEEVYLPRGVRAALQTFERDCPMCGWNPFKKRSSDKPAKRFDGAFKPGDTCPYCGGVGKVTETINWAEGYVEAYGVGVPEERSRAQDTKTRQAQDYLLAKKAAEVTATRNAIKLLAGVRVSRNKAADSPSYRQSIEATVKGAEHSEVASGRDTDPPYYIARAMVPLWGVKGLTTSLWALYSKSYGAVKHAAAPRTDLEEEYVIIIDARGSECPPHLFPRVVTEKGTVVYDISAVNDEVARNRGMARFVCLDEDIPHEELEKSFKESALPDSWLGGTTYAAFLVGDDEDEEPEKEDDKKPKKRRRRKKINLIVKGEKAGDKESASVVVSEADAKKMKEADEKTDSMKAGKVIILTDSRVAGKEGRIKVRHGTSLACFGGRPDAR